MCIYAFLCEEPYLQAPRCLVSGRLSDPQKQLGLKGPLGGCRQLPVPPGCLFPVQACWRQEGGLAGGGAGSLELLTADNFSSHESQRPKP